MLSFLFGDKKRQPSDRELDQAMAKGADLLKEVRAYSGMWSILTATEEINHLLPDGYMMQIPGSGTITQSTNGLILAYVGDNGQIVKYTIARREF